MKVFAIINLMLLLCAPRSMSQTIEDLWDNTTAQQDEFRIIDSLSVVNYIEFDFEDVVNPGLIRVLNDDIIIYDFYRTQLYHAKISEFHESFTAVGIGGGSGPNEYRFISYIDINQQGDIYALDTNLMRLMIWDKQLKNSIIRLTEVGAPGKVAAFENGYVIKHQTAGSTENLFTSYTKNHEVINNFHQVLTWENVISPLFYEGNITSNGEKIYYASSNYGLIKSYRINGDHIFTREMVEPLNGLSIRVNQDLSSHSVNRDVSSKFTGIDVDVYQDIIYVLYSGSGSLSSNRIDLYDIEAGSYLGSYIMQQETIKISVSNGRIYAIQEESEMSLSKIIMYDLK